MSTQHHTTKVFWQIALSPTPQVTGNTVPQAAERRAAPPLSPSGQIAGDKVGLHPVPEMSFTWRQAQATQPFLLEPPV